MFRTLPALVSALALATHAQDSTLSDERIGEMMDSIQNSLSWKTGHIELPGGKTALELPAGYRYLDPENAKTVIENLWGNPDGDGTLGMIFAPGQLPLDDSGWGVVVQYDDGGHIDDKDAADTDFGKLLESMKASTEEENKERKEQGYSVVHLEGWAESPHYDEAQKKLYWAKTLAFEGHADKTLNYYVRILGREGVLELNAVSSLALLPKVREGMASLNEIASFTEGNRYADFNSSTDKLSELGIAALVGGGVAVAAKAGLFKGLLIGLLAFKKVLLVGVVGLGAGVKAWWAKRKQAKEEREAKFGGDDFRA